MKIHYLSDTWPWFGKHQSYRRVVDYVRRINFDTHEVVTKYDIFNRLLGRAYIKCSSCYDRRDTVFAAAEFRFKRKLLSSLAKEDVAHVLYFDTHFHLFDYWADIPPKLVCTIHHPVGRQFPQGMERAMNRVAKGIVFVSEAVGYYEKYLGPGNVSFIPHGVDVNFFKPADLERNEKIRLLFTGQNGRNVMMASRIIKALSAGSSNICFDLVVPESIVTRGCLAEIAALDNVCVYRSIDESQMRDLYQRSYALFLPMNDSGANNAIVEALAAGLPVITTDVGGVRDYGGGEVYPLVSNNDDHGMLDLIERYISDGEWRDSVAVDCRRFAVENLAWEKVAQRHLEVYRELAG